MDRPRKWPAIRSRHSVERLKSSPPPDDLAEKSESEVVVRFNADQLKHIASVIDKIAIAYFSVIGYTSYTSHNWLLLFHAIAGFVVLEAVAVWVLKGRKAQ